MSLIVLSETWTKSVFVCLTTSMYFNTVLEMSSRLVRTTQFEDLDDDGK